MWPDIVEWMKRMAGHPTPAGNLPPLATYNDTLKYLAGGMPVVVKKPLRDGLYGTYDPKVPVMHGNIGGVPFVTEGGRTQDTVTVTNGYQSDPLPPDFVFTHEMGHKVYNTYDPNTTTQAQFGKDTKIQDLIGQLKAEGGDPSEAFARSFAPAMELVRKSGYVAPDWTMNGTAPIYVQAMAKWIREKLGNYDRRY